MTAEEILQQHNLIDELGYNQRLEIIECMKEFAIYCCEKQREVCAEQGKIIIISDFEVYVDKNTIINSPLPEQLQ